jgi:predicted ArsR family transcriptional regulator
MLPGIRLEQSPAGQILRLLQQHGALSIKAIEAALGVTTTAVRQQLMALTMADLIATESVREKRGRPHAVYRLTDKGQALFARGYEALAVVLLEEVLNLPDPTMMQHLLRRVSARLGKQYAEQMQGTAVAERLQHLVTWLDAHGVSSRLDEQSDVFVLTEYGCPYYGLAREHREVCEVEIEAMELALGSSVTLCHSQLDGHQGCQFQVKK